MVDDAPIHQVAAAARRAAKLKCACVDAVLAGLLLSGAVSAEAPDGNYDTNWGSGGTVVFDMDVANTLYAYEVDQMVVEPTGRLLVAGGSNSWYVGEWLANGSASPAFGMGDGSGLVGSCYLSAALCGLPGLDGFAGLALQPDSAITVIAESHMARLTSGGHALSTASVIGGSGYVSLAGIQINDAHGLFGGASAFLPLTSGKWLVAGYGWYSELAYNTGNRDFAVIRLNADFSLDTTFNAHTDGSGVTFAGGQIVGFDLGGGYADTAQQIAVQSDGKIVLVGQAQFSPALAIAAIARLNADGTLDATYGGGTGKVVPNFSPYSVSDLSSYPHGIKVDPADRLLIVVDITITGYPDIGTGLIRLLPSGAPDTTFHGNGLSYNEPSACFSGSSGFISHPNALTLDSAGRILVAGRCLISDGTYQFLVERLRGNDGSLDTSFGSSGYSIGVFAAGNAAEAHDIVTDASGHPVVGGRDFNMITSFYEAGMARLTYDLIFTNGYERVPPGYLPGQ